MRPPPRRRTYSSSAPGTSMVPFRGDTTAPSLSDLDPTARGERTEKPKFAVSPRARRFTAAALLLSGLSAIVILVPAVRSEAQSTVHALSKMRPPEMPDFASWSLKRPSIRLGRGPASEPRTLPVVAKGDDSASCAQLRERLDQLTRLVTAGVMPQGAISGLTVPTAQAPTCLDRAHRITALIADEVVARHLYVLGENGELIEKSPAELQAGSNPAPPNKR